mmetsp:Transcript_12411/g.18621  ORF Transcript_12411/g.18621 Transcript_12411/m.18621 type:complete len:240 (-) Transcript_12411:27-746(-)
MKKSLVKTFVDAQFAVGPIIPYIPQLLSLKAGKPSDGFSPSVSLIILIANILKVAFWFADRFEVTLLYQSLLLILMQLILLQALVANKVGFARKSGRQMKRSIFNDFWGWDSYRLYLLSTSLIVAIVSVFSHFLYEYEWYVGGLGSLAAFFDSVLGLPQLIHNHLAKNTTGISVLMVIGWVSGDFLKVAYYLAKGVPIVFLYGAALQIAIDMIVAFQLFVLYPNENIQSLGKKYFGRKN